MGQIQTYNRSHARYNRHNNFLRVRKRRQFLSWLGVQDARLTATGKTFTVKSTVAGVKASGVLTTDATLPADSSTVVIGVKTYTWQTVLTNVDGHVLIGATVATALANLASAINLGAGSGTTYAAATTANAAATTAVATATTVTVTAVAAGSAGNAFATTQAGTSHTTWGAATLQGGVDVAASGASQFTSASHGFKELSGPYLASNSGGSLPAGQTATQEYWLHVVDANTFQLSGSRRGVELFVRGLSTNSMLGVTGLGTGTQTLKKDIATKLGVFELTRRNKPETIMAGTNANVLN
jgi:hypothetical protein